jgi:SHS2 domain-containing protein
VGSIELSRLLRIETAAGQGAAAMMPENVLEKIAAPVRIFEPTILSHREIGPHMEDHAGKDADAVSNLCFVVLEDLDPLHPAARRAAFEDEAVETGLLELGEPLSGKALHPLGQILAGFRLDQPRCGVTFHETDWRPRHSEPDLDLRTHRHPLKELTEHLGDVVVELVAAVVADLGAEQTGRDADPNRFLVVPHLPGALQGFPSVHGDMMAWTACSVRLGPECYSWLVKDPLTGHREVEHTADWELEVWGPDMSALIGEAARGMYGLMEVEISEDSRCHRRLEFFADDREQLLVSFLGELLFLAEAEDLAFDGFLLKVDGTSLVARLEGGSILSRSKEIKAVTYHRLEISDTVRGLETSIIFDV